MIIHYRQSENDDLLFSGHNANEGLENKEILKRIEDNISIHAPLINVYGPVRLAHESKIVINS